MDEKKKDHVRFLFEYVENLDVEKFDIDEIEKVLKEIENLAREKEGGEDVVSGKRRTKVLQLLRRWKKRMDEWNEDKTKQKPANGLTHLFAYLGELEDIVRGNRDKK